MAVAPPPALGKDPPAPASTKVIFKDHACDVLQDAMISL
jgi:hypothetical protein